VFPRNNWAESIKRNCRKEEVSYSRSAGYLVRAMRQAPNNKCKMRTCLWLIGWLLLRETIDGYVCWDSEHRLEKQTSIFRMQKTDGSLPFLFSVYSNRQVVIFC
jgi:hypothetical protein